MSYNRSKTDKPMLAQHLIEQRYWFYRTCSDTNVRLVRMQRRPVSIQASLYQFGLQRKEHSGLMDTRLRVLSGLRPEVIRSDNKKFGIGKTWLAAGVTRPSQKSYWQQDTADAKTGAVWFNVLVVSLPDESCIINCHAQKSYGLNSWLVILYLFLKQRVLIMRSASEVFRFFSFCRTRFICRAHLLSAIVCDCC